MAIEWKDRIVEHPRRYQLVPVAGQEGVFDLVPVTGEVTEVGTPVNAVNMNSIEDELLKVENWILLGTDDFTFSDGNGTQKGGYNLSSYLYEQYDEVMFVVEGFPTAFSNTYTGNLTARLALNSSISSDVRYINNVPFFNQLCGSGLSGTSSYFKSKRTIYKTTFNSYSDGALTVPVYKDPIASEYNTYSTVAIVMGVTPIYNGLTFPLSIRVKTYGRNYPIIG